jgi:thioredoxin-related protein
MKQLAPVRERYENKGCRFLTVNIDDELATLEDFLNGNSIAYPVLYDDYGVAHAYKIRGIPHFVMIDRDGVIVSRFVGGTDATIKQIESELMRLLVE